MVRRAGWLVCVLIVACGAERVRTIEDPVTCGPGTSYDVDAGACVVALGCGPGTVLVAGLCRVADAGAGDAGAPIDAGPSDAGRPDGDAGVPDAGARDAGVPDAGTLDAGTPDAGPRVSCDGLPFVLFMSGSGYIFTGTQTITQATVGVQAIGTNAVTFSIRPASAAQGVSWNASFAAPQNDPILMTKAYPVATRFAFQSPDEAGLAVTGDGRGCNRSSGSFDVGELERDDAGALSRFSVSFRQLCENQPSNVLSGCLRYVR